MNLKTALLAGALLLCIAPAVAAKSKKAAPAPAPVAVDSLSHAVGTTFGHDIGLQLERLRSLGIAVDVDAFLDAMGAQLRNQPGVFTPEEANAWLDAYIAATRPDDLPDVLSEESQKAFVDSLAAQPGAVAFPDGLVMFVELEGEGVMPTDADKVRVTYVGKFYNGHEFDATTQPIEFPVMGLVPGFSEGLRNMKPGGKYRLIIPANLGYGPEGIPGAIPGNAALDFRVNLLEVIPPGARDQSQ